MKRKDVLLGKTVKEGRGVYIDPKDRSTHVHIIGATGTGKSKAMEHMIREDIKAGNGLCLIDPHGRLFEDVVKWCETKRLLGKREIILFNPAEEEYTFGFNPLKSISGELSFHVDTMVNAVAQVWGGENLDRTPTLKRSLKLIFHALAEGKHSLLEAHFLANYHHQEVRKYLTEGIEDPIIRGEWQSVNRFKPKEFEERFLSTGNRLLEFLSSPIVRMIIGQIKNTLDVRQIMDEGKVLLVNLSSSKDLMSDMNARLLGTLLVNDFFMKARGRPRDSRPFYLYIDECARYMNEDVARILDETRKFGLHLILAHQHLGQLKKAGDEVYKSVMTNARTKMVFGGLAPEDAEEMARQVFLGEFDLEEAKTAFNKPAVTGFVKTWMESYSKTTGKVKSKSSMEGGGSTTSSGEGSGSVYPSMDVFPAAQTFSEHSGSAKSSSWAEGESEAEIDMESQGRSQAFESILEWLPTIPVSLEEHIWNAMDTMVNQPQQHAIIKMPGRKSQQVKAPTIKAGFANDQRVRRFMEESYGLSAFVNRKEVVKLEIAKRWKELQYKAHEPEPEEEEPNYRQKVKPQKE